MDKAFFKNSSSSKKFGEIITLDNANKTDSDSQKYQCLSCKENVFLRQGNINEHCFAHHKAEKDDECVLRIQKQDTSDSKSNSDIKKWFSQHNNKDLEYNPHIPNFIFNDDSTWKALADILIDEINSEKRNTHKQFENKIVKKIDISSSSITRLILVSEKYSEKELLDFYWGIYLKFRLLFRLYTSKKRKFADGYYTVLFLYFDEKIPCNKNTKTLIPFSIDYDCETNNFKCSQFEEGKDLRVIDFLNPPNSLMYINQTSEISQLKEKKYLIAIYDFFENIYTSTNRQVPIGTTILILGYIKTLENMISKLKNFSADSINIIKNIDGLSTSWGIIEMELINPQNMSLSECPSWIAWRYLELSGGLKIKNEEKQYMITCPPVVVLNGNITDKLIEIKSEHSNPVKFTRNKNILTFTDIELGCYSIQIKETPYSIDFSVSTANLRDNENLNVGWNFNEKWPRIAKVSENSKRYISGTLASGFETKSTITKEKEWFILHSLYKDKANHPINRII